MHKNKVLLILCCWWSAFHNRCNSLYIKSAPTALGRKNQTWAAFVIGHFWLTKHTASPHFEPSKGLPPMCGVFTCGCSFQNENLFSCHGSQLLSLAACSLNLEPAVAKHLPQLIIFFWQCGALAPFYLLNLSL